MVKHRDLQMFGFKLNKYDFFRPLEVVGRGSEVADNFNKVAYPSE